MVTKSQNYSFIEQDPLLFNSATFRAALLRKVKSDSSALAVASGGGSPIESADCNTWSK